jgi:hypothetical protein
MAATASQAVSSWLPLCGLVHIGSNRASIAHRATLFLSREVDAVGAERDTAMVYAGHAVCADERDNAIDEAWFRDEQRPHRGCRPGRFRSPLAGFAASNISWVLSAISATLRRQPTTRRCVSLDEHCETGGLPAARRQNPCSTRHPARTGSTADPCRLRPTGMRAGRRQRHSMDASRRTPPVSRGF